MYLISGPSSINLIWKNSDSLTPKGVQLIGMRNILKLNRNGAEFCESDDSGRGPRPHPKSHVKPENRIWFHTHDSSATFLTGSHLGTLTSTFQDRLKDRVGDLSFNNEWSQATDLYSFVYNTIFPTQIEVLFGPSFLLINPDFASDFREFHRGLTHLLRGYPWWLAPKAWTAREKCLDGIKRWHALLEVEENDEKQLSDEKKHTNQGSEFIRARKRMHTKMKSLDKDAIASSELGVIWA